MTSLARLVIICGILLFTGGTIAWILTGNWQWFAGGLAIFIGTIFAGAILSVEIKQPRREEKSYPTTNSTNQERTGKVHDTQPIEKTVQDDPFAS